MKTFYTSQKEIANVIKGIITQYQKKEISEQEMIKIVKKLSDNNKELVFTDEGEFTFTMQQRCGKGRISILNKILK